MPKHLLQKIPKPLLTLIAALAAGVGVSYYWRVFYYLDTDRKSVV